MNPRELLDNIDNLEFDNNEINDIEIRELDIHDIVKERVRKKVKSIIRDRKVKKIKMAVSIIIGIFSFVIIGTPVIATNNSILSELYRKIGIFDEFEDYKKFIGITKEDNGFKVTIEEMVATPNTMIVAVKIQSPTPFLKDINDHLDVKMNLNKLGMTSSSGYTSTQYIDDYNFLIINEANNIEGLFPEKGNISINVSKLNEELEEQFNISFDINADFKSAFSDIDEIEINKPLGDIDIKSFTSSIIKSNLLVDMKNSNHSNLVNAFIINVDGRYHYGTSMFSTDNDAMVEFKTLKYSEVKEAKNISIIYTALTGREEFETDVIWEVENGISYPSEIITSLNKEYRINKVERDSRKVKLHIESNDIPIDLLTNLVLSTNSEAENIFWFGTMYKEENNNYIIEFSDVNINGDLKVNFSYYWKERNSEYFQEIKIK